MDIQTLTQDPQIQELINFYKQKLELAEGEYQRAMDMISSLKISHEESHSLSWEVLKRTKEVDELQQALSDFQAAVYNERKHVLKVVAENDALKIQELKDRKKIRFLLSVAESGRGNEDQVTYFKERLDKRLIKIGRVNGPQDLESRRKQEERDLVIMEDEIEGLKLQNSSLQTQLDEQRLAYDAAMDGLLKERRIKQEEDRLRREYDEERIETLMDKVHKMRTLCRENTRELLRTKKMSNSQQRSLMEEKTVLKKEISSLSDNLAQEQVRIEHAEKDIEHRVIKKQDTFVHDLKASVKKLEADLKQTKTQLSQQQTILNQKVEYYKAKFDSANANYNSLKKRRLYEIEGFTNDIINLRNQIKALEKNILKYGTLEERELVLLDLARSTGERAGKISKELQTLKTKAYNIEQEVQGLEI